MQVNDNQKNRQGHLPFFFLKAKKGKANPPPSLNWPISYASRLLIWKLLGCSSPVLPHLQSCVVPTLNTSSAGGNVFPEPRGKGELTLLPTAVPLAPGMQHREQRSSFSTAREAEAETPTARPLNSQQGKRKGHTKTWSSRTTRGAHIPWEPTLMLAGRQTQPCEPPKLPAARSTHWQRMSCATGIPAAQRPAASCHTHEFCCRLRAGFLLKSSILFSFKATAIKTGPVCFMNKL